MDFSGQFFFSSLTIAFLLALTVAQQEPINYWCGDNGNFTRNSTYETNLNNIFSSFTVSTANDYGFYNLSSGQGSDRVNALALCRGDVNSGNCISCINNATAELRNLCPNSKETIIWYDNCMFRYANGSILVDLTHSISTVDTKNVTDVNAFNRALRSLLDRLRNSVSAGTSLRKFATGSAEVTAFQNVSALVQCTPDLTQDECMSCLSEAIGFIPECCENKQGARVIGPSCYIRYEIYRFYDLPTADTPTLSPPPSNDTTGTTGISLLCSVKPTVVYFPNENVYRRISRISPSCIKGTCACENFLS